MDSTIDKLFTTLTSKGETYVEGWLSGCDVGKFVGLINGWELGLKDGSFDGCAIGLLFNKLNNNLFNF